MSITSPLYSKVGPWGRLVDLRPTGTVLWLGSTVTTVPDSFARRARPTPAGLAVARVLRIVSARSDACVLRSYRRTLTKYVTAATVMTAVAVHIDVLPHDRPLVPNEYDEEHQGRGEQAVQDSREDEQADRVQAEEIEGHTLPIDAFLARLAEDQGARAIDPRMGNPQDGGLDRVEDESPGFDVDRLLLSPRRVTEPSQAPASPQRPRRVLSENRPS